MDAMDTCPLFAGLNAAEKAEAMECLHARVRSYRRGEALHRIGEPLESFGLVLEGQVQVSADDAAGSRVIMAQVGQGEFFGESLCYLQREAKVQISAVTDARVLWLWGEPLRRPAENPLAAALQLRFTGMLASRALRMNDRIQVLSKSTLRQKLLTYLGQLAKQQRSSLVTVPLNRADLAAYLGSERSALCRELSRMQRDGLIDYRKDTFSLYFVKNVADATETAAK